MFVFCMCGISFINFLVRVCISFGTDGKELKCREYATFFLCKILYYQNKEKIYKEDKFTKRICIYFEIFATSMICNYSSIKCNVYLCVCG